MKKILFTFLSVFVCTASHAYAQKIVTVAWDPSPGAVKGYYLYAGTQSGVYTTMQPVGTATERTMALPPGKYYFSVKAYTDYSTSGFSNELVVEIPVAPSEPAGTKTKDWQIMWQHDEAGSVSLWRMHTLNMTAGEALQPVSVPAGWQIRASADFDGDHEKDLVLQNMKTGDIIVWIMKGPTCVAMKGIARLSDPSWEVVGAADFNGDKKPDLALQLPQGGYASVWFMDGTNVTGGAPLFAGRITDVAWRIVALTDVDGDGKTDLIWQHLKAGVITSWLMNGVTMREAGPFSVVGTSDPDWRIQGVADANGDGYMDLIWQHESQNYIATWTLKGRTVLETVLLNPGRVTPGWSIKAIR